MNTIPKNDDQVKRKWAELRQRSIAQLEEVAARRAQKVRAKQDELGRREAARQKIAPEPIEFDSRWNWACVQFNEEYPGNRSFIKAWGDTGKSWDVRDLGIWFEDIKALWVRDAETLEENADYE